MLLQLRDFEGFEKIGGRDIALSPGGRVGYSQHGVCSYVYKARWRGQCGGAPLALKVMAERRADSPIPRRWGW